MSDRPDARQVRPGELLAIDPTKIRRGPHGFFWLWSAPAKRNERRGDLVIVHIRGELDHHAGWADSYESIYERVESAFKGEDVREDYVNASWRNSFEDEACPDASPPKMVVLCLDSPGGVVAGLTETVKALQSLRKKHGIPLVAYINEMAASAAYALACSCDRIICPPSAIVGSIGVISTMVSVAKADKREGIDVVLITSGARKADGHMHAPLTSDAVAAERQRVDKLASAFFSLAAKSRKLSAATIQSYEAAIFLGRDAKKKGLVDQVSSFDAAIGQLQEESTSSAQAGGNQTERKVQGVSAARPSGTPRAMLDTVAHSATLSRVSTGRAGPTGAIMKRSALAKLIAKTEQAIIDEDDPAKRKTLLANLAAYKKTEKHIEHHKTEEHEEPDGDEDDSDDEGKDEDDEDSEESAASKSEDDEEATHKGKAAEDEEESEEEEAKAAAALLRKSTGLRGAAARGAARAMFGNSAQYEERLADLEKRQERDERTSLLASLDGKITKEERDWLSSESLATLKGFAKLRKRSGLVHTSEEHLVRPGRSNAAPGTFDALPEEVQSMIDEAVAAAPSADRKQLRESLISEHTKQVAKSGANGAGRY